MDVKDQATGGDLDPTFSLMLETKGQGSVTTSESEPLDVENENEELEIDVGKYLSGVDLPLTIVQDQAGDDIDSAFGDDVDARSAPKASYSHEANEQQDYIYCVYDVKYLELRVCQCPAYRYI